MSKQLKFFGKAHQVGEKIIAAFERGELAEPMAQVYIRRGYERPMDKWSIMNQLSVILSGCTDARGYDQWQEVGRYVREGEQAKAVILVPFYKNYTRKVQNAQGEEEEEKSKFLIGFGYANVFDVSQTDGEPLPDMTEHQELVASRPLVEVARAWGIDVKTYAGEGKPYLGYYSRSSVGKKIALGVENLSTWLHELMHAADDRLGYLTNDAKWRKETVAEFGAAVLAHIIGHGDQADEGGAYQYIKGYAKAADIDLTWACKNVLERVAECISLILETAEALGAAEAVAEVA